MTNEFVMVAAGTQLAIALISACIFSCSLVGHRIDRDYGEDWSAIDIENESDLEEYSRMFAKSLMRTFNLIFASMMVSNLIIAFVTTF